MKSEDLEKLLEEVKLECIKEKVNMLSVYRILHIIKTSLKNTEI